ncbi:MAG: DUF4124 domain-containing protein [Microcoleaceae cyanobacterium]
MECEPETPSPAAIDDPTRLQERSGRPLEILTLASVHPAEPVYQWNDRAGNFVNSDKPGESLIGAVHLESHPAQPGSPPWAR